MRIAFVSSEVFPFVKTGGLADVSYALPKALYKLGHNIVIFLPKYGKIDDTKYDIKKRIEGIEISPFNEKADLYETKLDKTTIKVYLVHNKHFFDRKEIYDDYEDNLERFSFFSKAVIEFLRELKYLPNIIHCNDWQTAMIPAYLKILYNNDEFFKKIKVLFTIHNLGYQGIFPKSKFPKLGIDWSYFQMKYFEYYDKINLLKAGIVFSDIINTVSEKYAEEIQTEEYGFGLHGVLKERSSDLYGILNGIDYDVWNPALDKYIWKNYSINSLEDKKINKQKLQEEYGLEIRDDIPLIGVISRLVAQKGMDLIIDIMDVLVEFDVQMVILGTGQKDYEEKLKKFGKEYPDKFSINIEFNNKKAHQIEAAADIFLMPSRYEPCGLNQMISLKYGTVPIVRYTGGLADTIIDIKNSENGNGFVFYKYDGLELLKTILRAKNTYKNKNLWKKIMINGMKLDFSFQVSAQKYEKLYYKLISK